MQGLFTRCADNPIITVSDLPFAASAVYNPGATERDGEVILLVRIEDCRGFSNIHVARSADGVSDWEVEEKPLLAYGRPELRYESKGCEDPRVTYLPQDDTYMVCYVAYSAVGPAVGLAKTRDFEQAERAGLILSPSNKDTVMFPEKIKGITRFCTGRSPATKNTYGVPVRPISFIGASRTAFSSSGADPGGMG